jgi:transcriptional regulator of arginine metabolism
MAVSRRESELRRELVRRILMDEKAGPMKNQKALTELLESLGIPAPQSSVSRDLRELGAVWVEGHYEIPTWKDDGGNPLERVLGFITGARAVADHFIFIDTEEDAGKIVGRAVKAALSQDILGVHAADDSVEIYTKNKDAQMEAYAKLRVYFEPPDEEEEPPSENGSPGTP